MRTYDFTPVFRSGVGFDRWSDLFDAAFRDRWPRHRLALQHQGRRATTEYRIGMAVAEFSENDVEITARENLLVVVATRRAAEGVTYLYRGIDGALERRSPCRSHQGRRCDAGRRVLQVDLERRLPEAMKPPHRRREQARFGRRDDRGQEGGRGQEGRLIRLRPRCPARGAAIRGRRRVRAPVLVWPWATSGKESLNTEGRVREITGSRRRHLENQATRRMTCCVVIAVQCSGPH